MFNHRFTPDAESVPTIPLRSAGSRLSVLLLLAGSASLLNGCAVIAVADAVVSTTVNVGAAVVNTAVDVTRAGVHAVIPSDDPKK